MGLISEPYRSGKLSNVKLNNNPDAKVLNRIDWQVSILFADDGKSALGFANDAKYRYQGMNEI